MKVILLSIVFTISVFCLVIWIIILRIKYLGNKEEKDFEEAMKKFTDNDK